MQIVAFNARIETVTEKPFFRNAFKSRRCIVPVSGFYEWQQLAEHKQPYYIYRGDQKPLALAGLWDSWRDPETGESIDSCSVITLPAAGALTDLHERMPAVLESDYFDPWLDPDYHETEVLLEILRQTDPARLNFYPVTSYVSNSRHDGAQCLEQQS